MKKIFIIICLFFLNGKVFANEVDLICTFNHNQTKKGSLTLDFKKQILIWQNSPTNFYLNNQRITAMMDMVSPDGTPSIFIIKLNRKTGLMTTDVYELDEDQNKKWVDLSAKATVERMTNKSSKKEKNFMTSIMANQLEDNFKERISLSLMCEKSKTKF